MDKKRRDRQEQEGRETFILLGKLNVGPALSVSHEIARKAVNVLDEISRSGDHVRTGIMNLGRCARTWLGPDNFGDLKCATE